jgi:hypothetical protein
MDEFVGEKMCAGTLVWRIAPGREVHVIAGGECERPNGIGKVPGLGVTMDADSSKRHTEPRRKTPFDLGREPLAAAVACVEAWRQVPNPPSRRTVQLGLNRCRLFFALFASAAG